MIALLLVIPAVFIMWLIFAHDHAPHGYQDRTGFHYGSPLPGARIEPDETTLPGDLDRVTEPKGSRLAGRTLP